MITYDYRGRRPSCPPPPRYEHWSEQLPEDVFEPGTAPAKPPQSPEPPLNDKAKRYSVRPRTLSPILPLSFTLTPIRTPDPDPNAIGRGTVPTPR